MVETAKQVCGLFFVARRGDEEVTATDATMFIQPSVFRDVAFVYSRYVEEASDKSPAGRQQMRVVVYSTSLR